MVNLPSRPNRKRTHVRFASISSPEAGSWKFSHKPIPKRPRMGSASINSQKKGKRKCSQTQGRQTLVDLRTTGAYCDYLDPRRKPPARKKFSLIGLLTPDEVDRYSISTQDWRDDEPQYSMDSQDDELPYHSLRTLDKQRDGTARFEADLQEGLQPSHDPLQDEQGPPNTDKLHEQHLAVMTAILHRLLQEKDFVGAGRALGIILRDDLGGVPNDIRLDGNWGIGAEILLRQDAQIQSDLDQKSRSVSINHNNGAEGPAKAPFTIKGAQDAKDYYERLIVLYPFRGAHPSTINALDFYPAMFGIWIYITHQQSKLEASASRSVNRRPSSKLMTSNDERLDDERSDDERPDDEESDDGDLDGGVLDEGGSDDESTSRAARSSAALNSMHNELSQAKKIAERMDSIMKTVPYKEFSELIELRNSVELWIRDLKEAVGEPGDGESESNNLELDSSHAGKAASQSSSTEAESGDGESVSLSDDAKTESSVTELRQSNASEAISLSDDTESESGSGEFRRVDANKGIKLSKDAGSASGKREVEPGDSGRAESEFDNAESDSEDAKSKFAIAETDPGSAMSRPSVMELGSRLHVADSPAVVTESESSYVGSESDDEDDDRYLPR